jgi:hypothetical protein
VRIALVTHYSVRALYRKRSCMWVGVLPVANTCFVAGVLLSSICDDDSLSQLSHTAVVTTPDGTEKGYLTGSYSVSSSGAK